MGLPDKDMTIENIHIYGFGGEAVKVKGVIQLPDNNRRGTMFRDTDGKFHDCGSRILS